MMHATGHMSTFICWCLIVLIPLTALPVSANVNRTRYNSMDIQELTVNARKEGSVVVYSFTSRILSVEKAFEKTYPGINLIPVDIESDRMIKRIANEQKRGIYRTDVAYLSDPAVVYKELLRKGYIENYIPPTFENRLPNAYKSPLLANRLSTKVLLYNEETYPGKTPVSNLWELTVPRWKGRVMLVDPLGRGDYMDLLTEIVLQSDMMAIAYKKFFGKPLELKKGIHSAGEQWITDLFINGLVLVNDTEEVNRAVGKRGQTLPPIGFSSYSDRKDNLKKGWALQIANQVDPMAGIAFPASLALVKKAPHQAAARLLIHFMMGDNSPTGGPAYSPFYVAGDYATRTDILPHPDAIPLEKLRAWQIDPENTLTIRDQVEALVVRLKKKN